MSAPEILFPPLFVEGHEYEDFTNTPPRLFWVQRFVSEGLYYCYEAVQARMDQGVSEDGSGALIVGVEYRHKAKTYSGCGESLPLPRLPSD